MPSAKATPHGREVGTPWQQPAWKHASRPMPIATASGTAKVSHMSERISSAHSIASAPK